MVKILSKSGDSLADMYDVVGSSAGIEQLESREVSLVHEMGATLFSERLSGAIRRATTGAIAQSTTFDIILTDLPSTPTRIFGCVVFADDNARLSQVTVSVQNAAALREIPIFAWDSPEDTMAGRIVDQGGAPGTVRLLANALNIGTLPSFLVGTGQPQPVDRIAFRGTSTAFGAGTVVITMLLYIGFSQVGGLNSRGLFVPGW